MAGGGGGGGRPTFAGNPLRKFDMAEGWNMLVGMAGGRSGLGGPTGGCGGANAWCQLVRPCCCWLVW